MLSVPRIKWESCLEVHSGPRLEILHRIIHPPSVDGYIRVTVDGISIVPNLPLLREGDINELCILLRMCENQLRILSRLPTPYCVGPSLLRTLGVGRLDYRFIRRVNLKERMND